MELLLYLKSTRGKEDLLPLRIKVFDHPLARKWVAALEDLFEEAQKGESARTHLQKNYCFFGLPNSERTLEFLCSELNGFIKAVNEFSQKEGWATYRSYYTIREHFTPENVYHRGTLNQELLNKLHHHFELMMGQVWSRSEFFKDADDEIRYALVQINHLCHEIESLVKAQMAYSSNPDTLAPLTMFSMLNPIRKPLAPEDFDLFKLEKKMGLVTLHYCQTSKPHYDAFLDKDEFIGEENVNGLRYFSTEFDIHWGNVQNEILFQKEKEAFQTWLQAKGLNPSKSSLGLGWAPLGEVDLASFGTFNTREIHKILENYQDIHKLKWSTDQEIRELNFPYSWKDRDYITKQMKLFSMSEEDLIIEG